MYFITKACDFSICILLWKLGYEYEKIFSIKNKYFIAFVVLIVIYFLWSVIWMGILFGNGFHYFDPEETILEKYIVVYTTQINTFLVPILRMAITGTGLKILYDVLKKLDLC